MLESHNSESVRGSSTEKSLFRIQTLVFLLNLNMSFLILNTTWIVDEMNASKVWSGGFRVKSYSK